MKSANVTVRVEPDVKEKAEAILSELGIPTSTAINMAGGPHLAPQSRRFARSAGTK